MYQDKVLIPAEAIRLAALGRLKRSELSYAELAADIRHVVSRVVGPNLDLLGSSLQILKLEGLVAAVDSDQNQNIQDDTILKITETGEAAFYNLMSSILRVPMDETCRLVYFLKLRFLDLLYGDEKLDQIDLLLEYHRGELARLEDLLHHQNMKNRVIHDVTDAVLIESLEMDIAVQKQRISWLEEMEAALDAA